MSTAIVLATIETFRNQVIHTEALTLINSLPDHSVDHLIADLPYGLAAAPPMQVSRLTRKGQGGAYNRVTESWDHFVPLDWMPEVKRILKPSGNVIAFCSHAGKARLIVQAIDLGWKLVNDVVWEKPDAPPNFSGRMMSEATERFVWFCPDGARWTYNRDYAKSINNGKNLRDVWRMWALRGERMHPTQKPLELMDRIVRLFTNPGDVILDPFCGSGTTLVAAKNAGRDYIGCDREEKFVMAARKRLAPVESLPLFAKRVDPGIAAGESSGGIPEKDHRKWKREQKRGVK